MTEYSEELKKLIKEEKQELEYNLKNNIISEIKDGHYILHHNRPMGHLPRNEICSEFRKIVANTKGTQVSLITNEYGGCTFAWQFKKTYDIRVQKVSCFY
jgi:hypothetical protein